MEGRPKFVYEFWHDHLRQLGFHLKAEVLEYPGGTPGDIGFVLTWKGLAGNIHSCTKSPFPDRE